MALRRSPAVRLLTAVLLLFGASAAARAQGAFDLLRMDPTARGAALGSHPVAVAYDGLSALAINPAGLSLLTGPSAGAAYTNHPVDLASGCFTWGRPMLDGGFAVSLNYFSYGSFERVASVDASPEGSFGAWDMLASVGYGRALTERISLGGSARLIHSRIDNYASTAAALDAALLVRTGVSMTDLAMVVRNLGGQLSTYAGLRESLPTSVDLGVAKKLEHLPLRLGVTAHWEAGASLFATASGEFTVSELLRVRAGYTTLATDQRVGGADDALAGISAGLGLTHEQYRLDYAFVAQGALGLVHRIGFGATL